MKLAFVVILAQLVVITVKGARKSDLFLRNSYIEGNLESHENAAQNPEDESGKSRVEGAYQVIYGSGRDFKGPSRLQPSIKKKPSLAGRSRVPDLSKIEGSPTRTWSKILEAYRKNYVFHIQQAIEKTQSKGGGFFANSQKIEECKRTFDICHELPGRAYPMCGAQCLTKSDPAINGVLDLAVGLVQKFCSPIGGILDRMHQGSSYGNERPFTFFHEFVRLLLQGKKDLVSVSQVSAESLLYLMINNIRTDLLPLRKLHPFESRSLAELSSKIKAKTVDLLRNTRCYESNEFGAMTTLMDTLFVDHNFLDVILEGHSVSATITKYLPGKSQLNFAPLTEGVRMMTGQICGLVHLTHADGANPLNCDGLGGFPTPGIPIPNVKDLPEILPECMINQEEIIDDKGDSETTVTANATTIKPQDVKNDEPPPSRKKRSEEVSSMADIKWGSQMAYKVLPKKEM